MSQTSNIWPSNSTPMLRMQCSGLLETHGPAALLDAMAYAIAGIASNLRYEAVDEHDTNFAAAHAWEGVEARVRHASKAAGAIQQGGRVCQP